MLRRHWLLSTVAVGALLTASAQSGLAQEAGATAAAPVTVKTVVVTAMRRSLQSAQQRKQNASQILDSIVAEDIGKLPDTNVADALRRVTGVQVTNDTDGTGQHEKVVVQGLPNVASEIDGLPIFTAGYGRTLNFETIPAEMIAAADVYKSPEAWQTEGGLGGLVDFRLDHPLDFNGQKYALTVSGSYSNQHGGSTPSASGFYSNRWNQGTGEMGFLIGVTYQTKTWETKESQVYDLNAYASPTDGLYTSPYGAQWDADYGTRHTLGINGSIQWKPSSDLEFYLDGYDTQLHNDKNVQSLELAPWGGTGYSEPVTDPVTYPGTNTIKSGTYSEGPGLETASYQQTDRNDAYQISTGTKWVNGPWVLSGDLSYTNSTYNQEFTSLGMAQYNGTATVDFGASPPTLSVAGTSISAPASYWNINSVEYYRQRTVGDEAAAKFDAKYMSGGDFLTDIRAGLRVSRRDQTSDAVDYNGTPYDYAGDYPNVTATTKYANVGAGYPGVPTSWTVPNPALLGNTQALFTEFGQNGGVVPGYDPSMHFDIDEHTYAVYAMGEFATEIAGLPVDGNFGLRLVDINQQLYGYYTGSKSTNYLIPLPSVNVRIKFTPDLYLRLAASRVMSQPDFQDQNPSIIFDNVHGFAYEGNPNLQPLKATQVDASLEYYFAKSSDIYGAAFYKDITNYVEYSASNEYLDDDGAYKEYAVTRPFNAPGTVKGLEAGYQQFFDFLPAPFNGLGAQANYTYLDSVSPNANPLLVGPLPSLSKGSANLIGMYETEHYSARIGYNWRSSFVDQFVDANFPPLARVQYEAGYGTLDASLGYHFNNHFSVFLEGSNLTQPLRKIYYSDGTNAGTEKEDLTLMFGLRITN